ncbi:MAG: M3 family oligoendopeptidase [Salaquimonas sp.]
MNASMGGEKVNAELGKLPQWKLEDLYPSMDSRAYSDDVARSKKEAASFHERYAGKLADLAKSDPAGLFTALVLFEEIEQRMGRIMSYAALVYTGDTTEPEKAKFYGDAQEKITDASSHLLFFGLEFNRIEGDLLEQAMAANPELARYRPWIEDLRKDKPYQLDDRTEQLFLEKSVSGHSAWNRLFDETMASLRFTIDDEELTVEPTLNLLQDVDRKKREAAAKEIGRVLSANARTFTLITNTLAKDKEISDRWRGFEDVAHSRHLSNRIEPEVVDALVATVEKSFPATSHRYYAMKAKWLGLEKLEQWDRNAPLPSAGESLFGWEEARDIVLEAYSGFAPEMANIAKRFFDEQWIDAQVRPGKSPGAFAHPTVPDVHPYVMINYMGKPRDVMTLAHELGHGVHQVLAAKQGLLMSQTPLTLAETASVFGEMLTFRSLLSKATSLQQRKAMLARKVEDMINTVVRQIAFYIFERKVHEGRKQGELTSLQLNKFWLEVQKSSLGPIFNYDDTYASYWSYIPHFVHSPFYVYAYAFGDCLVNSLYAVYENAEDGFQERYFELLKAGGTKHHSELLKPFGLDASDPEFWSKGIALISGLIDELDTLDKQIAAGQT